ncbi:MAG: pilus assembly protein N-terminal domain-containing protein [Verrucomicrobia bacterium]|nr:pilus assembly protein N-terminal domain-containing protein [Verrucomicrobiota bacterium]MDA1087289.1 pilus assembly protein N-terminal domain-containing protein [Verrucomicrobiota bacterium]
MKITPMHSVRLFAMGACAVLASVSITAAQAVKLVPGSTHKIDIPVGVAKIMVANPDVIDAQPTGDGNGVLVTGKKPGTSELRVARLEGEDAVYNVSVVEDLSSMAAQIEELLGSVEGLKVSQVGDKVVLDGNLLTKSDHDRVTKVAEAYRGLILPLYKLDRSDLNKFVAEAIKRDIGIDTVIVRVAGETATLEGVVYDENDAKRASEVAKLRVSTVVNLIAVEEVMIEIDVHFVEVTVSDSENIGFNVLKTLGVDIGGSAEGGTGASDLFSYNVGINASARLNLLLGKGNGRVVAKPHITTKSGGEGRFHNGGEVYFKVTGNTGGSLEKVEHGIILTVKPTLRGRDRIMTEVTIEVSVPTAQAGGGDLALDKFETTSTTICKTGESILLSGLVQQLENRFNEKAPLLGDIPLLKTFFSEKTEAKEKKELVVLLTPRAAFATEATGGSFSKEREALLEE